jgi:hypothetical protein
MFDMGNVRFWTIRTLGSHVRRSVRAFLFCLSTDFVTCPSTRKYKIPLKVKVLLFLKQIIYRSRTAGRNGANILVRTKNVFNRLKH